jgi:tetratricopeptide (TPR) repeat protein
MPQASRELTANDNPMTVHEAYLIERGDREAIQLAELRYASSLSLTYRNSLGFVMGVEDASPEMIVSGVESMADQLIVGNYSQAARALNGLKVVISAAEAEQGDFPKGVIFVSSGFTVGRGSLHADVAHALDDIIAAARRQRVRIYTVDAEGLAVHEALGIGANGAFLVGNPHLQPIIERHAYEWQHAKESLLIQLAAETGGRFSHGTNDLAMAAGSALRSMGQLYYLGYLSRQPPDGRYHRIRVVASLPGARVHAREGYFARPRDTAENGPEAGGAEEPWDILLARATEASRAGDASQLAAALEKLVLKFPNQASLWYNLGAARLQLGSASRAAEAFQRAFVLSPESKMIGSTLARALVAAGFREAAADVTELMIRRHPRDVELIMQLGRVFEADGRTEQAYWVYRRALDYTLVPPLDLYVLLTRTASRLGRRVEADVFIRDYDARGGDPSAIESWRQRRTGSDP